MSSRSHSSFQCRHLHPHPGWTRQHDKITDDAHKQSLASNAFDGGNGNNGNALVAAREIVVPSLGTNACFPNVVDFGSREMMAFDLGHGI